MPENGQETYLALTDFAGESRPRKFDQSRIGFERHEDVTGKICLIYKDGGKYYFIYKSFLEYFVVYF